MRRTWRVGFYVEVEVDAYEGEAATVAEAACGWPGTWSLPHAAVPTEGVINGKTVAAQIIRSQALMVKPEGSAAGQAGYRTAITEGVNQCP